MTLNKTVLDLLFEKYKQIIFIMALFILFDIIIRKKKGTCQRLLAEIIL